MRLATFAIAAVVIPALHAQAPVPLDRSGYSPRCGIDAREDGGQLHVSWPVGDGAEERVVIDLRPGRPLIAAMGIAPEGGALAPALQAADPIFAVTVGSREAPAGRPPEMSVWNVFFDTPANRPHQRHVGHLELRRARLVSEGKKARLELGDLALGPFRGEIHLTIYAGSRLIHLEAAASTTEDRRAYIYDAGLAGDPAALGIRQFAWMDTEGRMQESPANLEAAGSSRTIAVRHRAVFAEGERGSVACFPPPHQFFFPRDLSDNLKTVWTGAPEGLPGKLGLGVRQSPKGGGGFVPWFNAPPGTVQRMGFFLLPSAGKAEPALREVLRFTGGDRFPSLPGHITFTSHWHMAIAVAALEARKAGRPPPAPDFPAMFKEMNVDAVHLGEFHGDGHQKDPGPLRLPEMEAMMEECRRLSDRELLLIPGEEVNDFLGIKGPGKHPGHWMSFFPRPVHWTMQRPEGRPFREEHPRLGAVYHVGSREDMVALLRAEKGLAWAAHPRIKASSWTPDIFRKEDFYLDDLWLGGAWKSMPADLSRERLGERCLDLLDDMANWGQRKYLLGEVDVFKIDHTHELYGHMNINYLRLDRLPRFEEGWEPILAALREGRFFVTTGEVLIRELTVGGKRSGESLAVEGEGKPEVKVDLEWTFPLKFLEVISGDGEKVHRHRLDVPEAAAFERRTFTVRPELSGRRWMRLEAWDIAANGAFSQPVWLETAR